MLILVNPSAGGGRGAKRWARVERALLEAGRDFRALTPASADEAWASARSALEEGERVLVTAGGDGSVNGLLNAVMDPATDAPRAEVVLGAIGLGSSNDFHKPFGERLAGQPVCLDAEAPRRVDVGKAVVQTAEGEALTRYFLLGASVGLVAEGNAYFNRDLRVLGWLKAAHTELAIVYTAFVNLWGYRAVKLTLSLDGGEAFEREVTNLSVIKRVFLSGGMRYDTPVTQDDGHFDVNLVGRLGRAGIVRAIANLYRGRFRAIRRAEHWRARALRVTPAEPAALELDGEVWSATEVTLSVVPRALRLCR